MSKTRFKSTRLSDKFNNNEDNFNDKLDGVIVNQDGNMILSNIDNDLMIRKRRIDIG